MTAQIEAKMNPATAELRPTARRLNQIASSRQEGKRLAKIQAQLYALADRWEAGTVPEILQKVTSKAIVDDLSVWNCLPGEDWEYYQPTRKRLIAAGLDSDEKVAEAQAALNDLVDAPPAKNPEEIELEELIMAQTLSKEPGWFQTPPDVVARMVDLAGIEPGDSILEPSAGLGAIADALPKDQLKVVEWNSARRRALELKGYELVSDDFLSHLSIYDKIIMNPPFENGQDIDHIRHAYTLLKAGGRVVCIMCEGPFCRSDKKSVEFRNWLEWVDGQSYPLPEDAFKPSGTSVRARLVVIDKEHHSPPQQEPVHRPVEPLFSGQMRLFS